jgi:hypothetical protein
VVTAGACVVVFSAVVRGFVTGGFVTGAFVTGGFVTGAFVTGGFVTGAFVTGGRVTAAVVVIGADVTGADMTGLFPVGAFSSSLIAVIRGYLPCPHDPVKSSKSRAQTMTPPNPSRLIKSTFTLKLSGSSYPHHKEFWTR